MTTFRTVRVTTENGYSWTTNIHGTNEEIEHYFLGQRVDTKPYPQELLSKVVKIEFLPDQTYPV